MSVILFIIVVPCLQIATTRLQIAKSKTTCQSNTRLFIFFYFFSWNIQWNVATKHGN